MTQMDKLLLLFAVLFGTLKVTLAEATHTEDGHKGSKPGENCATAKTKCPVPDGGASCHITETNEALDFKPAGDYDTCCPVYNCTNSHGSYRLLYLMSSGELPSDPELINQEKGAASLKNKCPNVACAPQPDDENVNCAETRDEDSSTIKALGPFRECCDMWKCNYNDGSYFTHFEILAKTFWKAETTFHSHPHREVYSRHNSTTTQAPEWQNPEDSSQKPEAQRKSAVHGPRKSSNPSIVNHTQFTSQSNWHQSSSYKSMKSYSESSPNSSNGSSDASESDKEQQEQQQKIQNSIMQQMGRNGQGPVQHSASAMGPGGQYGPPQMGADGQQYDTHGAHQYGYGQPQGEQQFEPQDRHPFGSQGGQQRGQKFGPHGGQHFGSQGEQQLGPQSGQQFGPQGGQQFGPQGGQQFGPQSGLQFGQQFGSQTGPQFGPQGGQQFGPQGGQQFDSNSRQTNKPQSGQPLGGQATPFDVFPYHG